MIRLVFCIKTTIKYKKNNLFLRVFYALNTAENGTSQNAREKATFLLKIVLKTIKEYCILCVWMN